MASLRILAVPSSDNGSPLLPLFHVQVEGTRYLFNVPESTTRSLTQRKTSFARCAHVFVSAVGTDSTPGLAGLLMTLADAGRSDLSVHGPQTLAHAIASMRFYAKRDSMNLNVHQFPHGVAALEKPFFRDGSVAIEALQLVPSRHADQSLPSATKKAKVEASSSLNIDKQPWLAPSWRPALLHGEDAEKWVHAVVKDMFHYKARTLTSTNEGLDDLSALRGRPVGPAWVPHPLPEPLHGSPINGISEHAFDDDRPALCYVLRSHPQRGKFDPSAALAAGVPPGPLWATLTRGEAVRVSRPKQMTTWPTATREQWTKQSRSRPMAAANVRKGHGKGRQGKGGQPQPSLVPDLQPEDLEEVAVAPSEVMGARRPGFVVIQIYIPSDAHAVAFFSEEVQERLAPYRGPSTHDETGDEPTHNAAHLVIHSVTPSVMFSAAYQAWMRSFPPTTYHLVSSYAVCKDNFAFPSAAMTLLRLQELDKNIFRLPYYELTNPSPPAGAPCDFPANCSPAEPDLLVSLLPSAAPQHFDSGAPDFHFAPDSPEAVQAMSFQIPEGNNMHSRTAKEGEKDLRSHRARLQQARERTWDEYAKLAAETRIRVAAEALERSAKDGANIGRGVVITPLGTGSAHPSKYRNVSATLVQTAQHGNILLDAGEGTYGQLRRRFAEPRGSGSHAVDAVIRNLKCIFISHIHADHHLGVAKILVERLKLSTPPTEPLYIVSNSFTRTYLLDYDKIEPLGIAQQPAHPNGVIFVESEHLDFESGVHLGQDADELWQANLLEGLRRRDAGRLTEAESSRAAGRMATNREQERRKAQLASGKLRQLIGCTEISTVVVDHRAAHCYGLVLRSSEGWSLAYSGDTRPCASLARAARGVTVLLHEATLQDEEAAMAYRKGHSTVGQAIQVAKEAQVDHLILTHFSQRYPKLARRTTAAAQLTSDVATLEKTPTISSAFDLVSMPITDLWKVDRYQAAMEKLFEADVDDGDAGSEAGSFADGGAVARVHNHSAKKGVQKVQSWLQDTRKDAAVAGEKNIVEPSCGPVQQPFEGRDYVQRLNTDVEWRYVILNLTSDGSMRVVPTVQALHSAMQTALTQMHGLVGGSIRFDVLNISEAMRGSSEAVLKVERSHLSTVLNMLSGPVISTSSQDSARVRVTRGRHGLNLAALISGTSSQWLKEVAPDRPV